MINQTTKMGGIVATHRPHNCYYYVHTNYFIQSVMTGRKCAICGKITNAHYRSLWMRVLAVFKLDEWWDGKFQDTSSGE